MGYLQFGTALLSSSLCALAAKTCDVSSLRAEPTRSLLQFRFAEIPDLLDPLLPSPKTKSNTTGDRDCKTASPPGNGYSYCYSKECDEQGNVDALIQSDCESVGGKFTKQKEIGGKLIDTKFDCGKLPNVDWHLYSGHCEPVHVPEKCLTKKSFFSSESSRDPDCCAPYRHSTEANCLDGYHVDWKEEKCGPGADFDGNAAAEGSAAFSIFSAEFWTSASAGQRRFECIPSKTNDNGRLQKGMPGTEHRRRWLYNKGLSSSSARPNTNTTGETGSCCGLYSCIFCKENHSIRVTNEHCGFGQKSICASQY